MRKELKKAHRLLTPVERFRTCIEAAARDDHEEVDRLMASCRRVGFEGLDPELSGRINASKELVLGLCIDIRGPLGFLDALASIEDLLGRGPPISDGELSPLAPRTVLSPSGPHECRWSDPCPVGGLLAHLS